MGVRTVAAVKHAHDAVDGNASDFRASFAGPDDPFDSNTAPDDSTGPVTRIALDFDNPLPPPSCSRFRRINVPCLLN